MGTLNPYRAPFLDGNWISDTPNTIGVNYFQLKVISEMFEMFVLLINEINPHNFCFVSYLFSFYLHVWSSPTQRIAPHDLLYCIFENLPWEFAVRICRGYLPWVFCIYKRIFFVYVGKSSLYGGKPFSDVCKTFWFVKFSLLTVLLLVIVVAIMGHRTS